MILPGRRFEMSFEFHPQSVDVAESFWRFVIPSASLSQLFLVAGIVSEPRVTLDRAGVAFRPLMVGACATEVVHLKNDESIPLAYDVQASHPELKSGVLRLSSYAGIVPAMGILPLEVTLAPAEERMYNVHLLVTIARKPTPLTLNVKGDGYALRDSIMLADEGRVSGPAVELSTAGANALDFGDVQVNERGVKRLVLSNAGMFAYDFAWSVQSEGGQTLAAATSGGARGSAAARALARTPTAAKDAQCLVIKPMAGKVAKGGSVTCDIEFVPTHELKLNNLLLTCVVANTKKYTVAVSAQGTRAALEFSTHELTFGDCLMPLSPTHPALPVVKVLSLVNRELHRDISVQCTFTKRPHLDVAFDAAVLRPGQVINVPVTFMPRQAQAYGDMIPFEINGLHVVNVEVRGTGVPLALDVQTLGANGAVYGSPHVLAMRYDWR
ncbi:hypothetical protein EON62_04655, partial [archaeon]